MSKLIIDQLEGRTSSTVTDINDLKYQLATAWVNFNGTGTVAIMDQYNVASITDNGTGNYTANFTTAMNNANYAVSESSGYINNSIFNSTIRSDLKLTDSCSILTFNGTLADSTQVSLIFQGGI